MTDVSSSAVGRRQPKRPPVCNDVQTVGALTAFADLLETHVRREERELFEHFPDGVPPADAHALGENIRRLLGR